MAEERAQRRLAAILAADVVGYSRLMEQDEAGTMAALADRRKAILEPLLTKYRGRVVRLMGDGTLAEFASAVDAVQCAVNIQKAMREANAKLPEDRAIVLRVGLNLGDVVVEEGDLYGDGVNVAARLEAIADAGGICLSAAIHQQVERLLPFAFKDLGDQALKNIARPVRVYCIADDDGAEGIPRTRTPTGRTLVQGKPSIAVLPFDNLSGDPEQDYFADGITEDIITDLSQVSALFVVARNTAFTFKGKSQDIVQTARKLNVGHILEGSVRKAGGRVRITAQLIDGMTGGHLWAERYDRDLGDIFALQDEIAKSIVGALKIKLLPDELKAITTRSTKSAEAYDCYLHARATLQVDWSNKAMLRSARRLFERATEIDGEYAEAFAGMADCDAFLWIAGDLDVSYQDIFANSSKALNLAPNLAEAQASNGLALYLGGDPTEAIKAFERAIALNPDLWAANTLYGYSCRATGRFEEAALCYERAAKLKSDDWDSLAMLADVYESLGRHDLSNSAARRALARYESALGQRPNNADGIAVGAAMLAFLGEKAKAVEWAKRAIVLDPESYSVRYNVACVHAVGGNPDAALECLEYIYLEVPRARRWLLGTVKHDVQLKSLRDRSDFQALVSRLEAAAAEQS